MNGSYLGPTLRAQRGERVVVNVHNGLAEPTTMHWHGMHVPARYDGGPHTPIAPQETWSPTWIVDQPAASLWYHPHPHDSTALHVYRGVAGMFLIDEEESTGLGLPQEYGVDDVPLIVQDKKFHDDGTLDEGGGLLSPTGPLGGTITVNGVIGPYLDVTTTTVRLRVLNASGARVYNVGLDSGAAFTMIASDGGLLAAPYDTDRLLLSPGERAEILVAVQPGERTVLRSFPGELGADFFSQRFAGGDDTLDLIELRAADTLTPSEPVPTRLAELPRLDAADARVERTFELSGSQINGAEMEMARIDETVELGATEIWRVTNASGTPHNFHIHDVQFQVLDVDGEPPPEPLRGWKDTVYLPPNSTFRLIMRFTDYADPNTPYMYHCHVLRHEDQGLMGQFVVVEPGSDAGTPHTDHNG